MTERKRCRQPWVSKHATDSNTIGTITNFTKTREYLKVDANITLESFTVYDTKENIVKKLKPNNH